MPSPLGAETLEYARPRRLPDTPRFAARGIFEGTMDESGVDMGFDLTAAFAVTDPIAHHVTGDYDDDFEQALSLLSTSTKELMYYELKSRAPNTGRYVRLGADDILKRNLLFNQTHRPEITRRI